MATTEKNLTIDMLDNIERPEERLRVLAMYVKQLGKFLDNLTRQHKELSHNVERLKYLLKGPDERSGGLEKQIEDHKTMLAKLEKRQEQLEDAHTQFRNEFKIVMAKATAVMSIFMVIFIPILNRIIDKLIP